MKKDGFKVVTLSTLYYKSTKLERAIDRLFVEVDKAFREGANILVLSDRGVDENHMPIPSLLAVSAVHQHLGSDLYDTADHCMIVIINGCVIVLIQHMCIDQLMDRIQCQIRIDCTCPDPGVR